MNQEYDKVMTEFETSLNPYRTEFQVHQSIPKTGQNHADLLTELETMKSREEIKWQSGFASGAVYHGDAKHIDFINKVYSLHS